MNRKQVGWWASVSASVVLVALVLAGCVISPTATPLPSRALATLVPAVENRIGAEPTSPSVPSPTSEAAPTTAAPSTVAQATEEPDPSRTASTQSSQVYVTDLELRVAQTLPVQVTAVLRGNLADSCAQISSVEQQVRGESIVLDVRAVRSTGVECAQALRPFEATTMLDTSDLLPGRYVVRAGEAQEELVLGDELLRPTPAVPTPANLPQRLLAPVESVHAIVTSADPLRIEVVVSGSMPDACTQVTHFGQRVSGSTIYVSVYAGRPQDAMCAQVLTPYETTLPLNVAELERRQYTLDANGVTTTLTLPPTSGAGAEPTPTGGAGEGGSNAYPAPPVIGEAAVEEVRVLEASGDTATVVALGALPDGCTQVADYVQAVQGTTIRVELYTTRAAGMACTEALVPFEHELTLDLKGLEAGEYVVDVNGASAKLMVARS